MDIGKVKKYYSQRHVVESYSVNTKKIGLWAAEEKVFSDVFDSSDHLLELGCGTGRITVGLWEKGYRDICAIDQSNEMILEAQRISNVLNYPIDYRYGNAEKLEFDDESFSGAIFGFNGLMTIPERTRRANVLSEVFRVLIPGSTFVFTTGDRYMLHEETYWHDKCTLWRNECIEAESCEFGDVYAKTRFGYQYEHMPIMEELCGDLAKAGFLIIATILRSYIGRERESVRDSSKDCRFWVVQKLKQI